MIKKLLRLILGRRSFNDIVSPLKQIQNDLVALVKQNDQENTESQIKIENLQLDIHSRDRESNRANRAAVKLQNFLSGE